MKTTFLLLGSLFTFFINSVFAQELPDVCPFPQLESSVSCADACIICNIDGLHGRNGLATGGQSVCAGLLLHNPNWIGFLAGSSSITFDITSSMCEQGHGLQAFIAEDCFPTVLACTPGVMGGEGIPLQVSYDQFVEGQVYYLVIDGFNGDVCDYEVRVADGWTGNLALGGIGSLQGESQVCANNTVFYDIPDVYNATYYHWVAPPGSSINHGINEAVIPAGQGNSVMIQFGSMGGDVCVTAINACTQETATTCQYVTVSSSLVILPPLVVPFEDLPFVWPVDGMTVLDTSATYQLTAELQSVLGCDSIVRQTVTILEPGANYVAGVVYWDHNTNGLQDAGESLYTGGAVLQATSGSFSSSDSNGSYTFQNLPVGDTIRLSTPPGAVGVLPDYRVVLAGQQAGYNFGLEPEASQSDLAVQFSMTPLRLGFSSYLKLYCKNNSAFSVNNASLSVLLPNLVQYDGASVMPNLILGDTYTWNLATLIPGEIKIIDVTITTPVGTPLGTSVNVSATILPITHDENPTNNVYERQYVVTGAFDPNDKLVHPPFVTPGMLQNGAPFEYTIRFQNTGTAPATFVRIVDTLNALLSPETFRFVASSHPCTWSIKDRGVVDIFFDDIQLPDSTSNEPASHGFARFTILPKSNLPLGTIVPNFCDIYFDYNEPVRTNTAGTQVVYFLPGQGLLEQPSLLFKPNPAAVATRAHWKTPAPADGRIRLFDARGLPQLEMPVIAGQTSTMIPLEQLHPGLYFVVLESGNLMLSNKLVVINLIGLNSNN